MTGLKVCTGGCHCGQMRFECTTDLATMTACNCSICRRKGYLLHFSSPDKFTLQATPEAISVYTFNTHNIRHQFCATCGCAPHGDGTGPDGTKAIVINLRCADGISHSPEEDVREIDVARGLDALEAAVLRVAAAVGARR